MFMNLIDEYVETTREHTDAPEIYLRASGYHLISTLLGQFFEIQWLHRGRPNLWFLLSSIPGRMRRSTVSSFDDCVLYNSLIEYYMEIMNIKKKDAIEIYANNIIEDGSYEGIQDKIIQGVENGVTNFSILSTEFGDVIRKLSGKGYRQGTDVIFSKLYYGERHVQSLSQRGGKPSRFIPEGLYVTMFAGMQEPHLYLNQGLSRQGLLRRILLIYVKGEDLSMEHWREPLQAKNSEVFEKLKNFSKDRIVPLMIRFHRKNENQKKLLQVDITTFAREKINSIARKADETLINDASDYALYKQTYWEHLTKLSLVEALSMESVIGDSETMMAMVDKEHLVLAFKFLKEVTKHSEDVMEDLDARRVAREHDTAIDHVYNKIRKAGVEGISKTKLLNNISGMNSEKLNKILLTLLEAGKIKQDVVKTKGKPKNVFRESAF